MFLSEPLYSFAPGAISWSKNVFPGRYLRSMKRHLLVHPFPLDLLRYALAKFQRSRDLMKRLFRATSQLILFETLFGGGDGFRR